jgi:hypothetical protein
MYEYAHKQDTYNFSSLLLQHWIRFLFSRTSRMFLGSHPAPIQWIRGSFPGIKQSGCEINLSPQSSGEVKNEWSCTSLLSVSSWRGQRKTAFLMAVLNLLPIPVAALSKAACLLGLRVLIPPGALMSLSCECYVFSGRDLCDGPILSPEESYPVWCVLCAVRCNSNP